MCIYIKFTEFSHLLPNDKFSTQENRVGHPLLIVALLANLGLRFNEVIHIVKLHKF